MSKRSELKISDLMTRDVLTLDADESLLLAEDIMQLGRLRHLPVEQGGKLIGLVTHRDLLRASLSSLEHASAEREAQKLSIPVRRVMQSPVRTVSPDTPAVTALEIMLENRFGCLVVVDAQNRIEGIVSEADFLRLAHGLLTDKGARP